MEGDSGARHDRVSIKDATFFSMPIKIPNKTEQQKIADFLSLVDKRMANGAEVEPTGAITFRLPVPASVQVIYAKVLHEGENIGIFEIKGEGNAKYVEISSADFSKFTVVPIALSTNNYDLAGEGTAASPYQINNLTDF